MPERWRLFVAVPVPAALRADLAEQLAPMRAVAPDGIRWVDPDAWHLTLAFLGDTDPARVPDLVAALREAVAPLPAFTPRIGGLGAFPRASSARVIWLGVYGGEDLRQLARVVAEACGVDREEPFRAHITLARLRSATPVGSWLLARSARFGSLSLDRILVMRSDRAGLTRHQQVAMIRFGDRADSHSP